MIRPVFEKNDQNGLSVFIKNLKVGDKVEVKHNVDNKWYPAKIVEQFDLKDADGEKLQEFGYFKIKWDFDGKTINVR